MKRHPLPPKPPRLPGRCAWCGMTLTAAEQVSILRFGLKLRLVCRDWLACCARRWGVRGPE